MLVYVIWKSVNLKNCHYLILAELSNSTNWQSLFFTLFAISHIYIYFTKKLCQWTFGRRRLQLQIDRMPTNSVNLFKLTFCQTVTLSVFILWNCHFVTSYSLKLYLYLTNKLCHLTFWRRSLQWVGILTICNFRSKHSAKL